MNNYDVTVYIQGTKERTILTQAPNPVHAFDLAIRQLYKLPDDEKSKVVGMILKLPKQENAS